MCTKAPEADALPGCATRRTALKLSELRDNSRNLLVKLNNPKQVAKSYKATDGQALVVEFVVGNWTSGARPEFSFNVGKWINNGNQRLIIPQSFARSRPENKSDTFRLYPSQLRSMGFRAAATSELKRLGWDQFIQIYKESPKRGVNAWESHAWENDARVMLPVGRCAGALSSPGLIDEDVRHLDARKACEAIPGGWKPYVFTCSGELAAGLRFIPYQGNISRKRHDCAKRISNFPYESNYSRDLTEYTPRMGMSWNDHEKAPEATWVIRRDGLHRVVSINKSEFEFGGKWEPGLQAPNGLVGSSHSSFINQLDKKKTINSFNPVNNFGGTFGIGSADIH